jgi:hypothetical protein
MSHCWVAARAPESALALCIETPRNTDRSNQEGYREMGAVIGLTLSKFLQESGVISPKP